jgi:hypothetical protein
MRPALSFVAGCVLAGFVWWFATPAYHRVLAGAITPLLQIDSRLRGVRAETDGRQIQVRKADDLGFPHTTIPAEDYTYNLILFGGLIAMRRGSARRVAIATAILAITHVLGIAASIEATFAARVAGWSDLHYGGGEQDFWIAAEYSYRLAGLFGIAFGLWYLTLPPGEFSPRPRAPREPGSPSPRA